MSEAQQGKALLEFPANGSIHLRAQPDQQDDKQHNDRKHNDGMESGESREPVFGEDSWRMHLASEWLRGDRIRVAQVATRLGYESEASFSRAFKRWMGVPPSALRRPDRPKGRSRAPRRERVGLPSRLP